ncbi:MAG: LysR family transcriptional regulator [Clostridia bacterium]|nr:LysR family transcriptional regulator [Clostridia bacterium]
MDTLKIRALLSAVKHKSLSKAAEEISYTPSALSHMADSLEAELGVRLLKRTPLGVEWTEDGLSLYESLVAVIKAEKELFNAAEKLSSQKERELRIGTYSSISQYVLPEILKSFKKAHPSVQVSIRVGNDLHTWLEEGFADVVFADLGAVGQNEWVPIMTDPFVAIVPHGSFSGQKSVEREELYEYPYISTNESALRKYFDESRFKEIIRFDSVDDMSAISMVNEGIGVTVLPSLVFQKQYKGVRALKLKPEIARELGFSYKKNAVRSLGATKFIAYLKNEIGFTIEK